MARVVVATRDPDPRVDGAGVARLRAAGVAVTEGVLAAEARELVLPASPAAMARHRPLVTLKLASTLDGRIATRRRREPLDHRRAGAPHGARAARPARRGAGRCRHGAGRRSGPDLPDSRLPSDPSGADRCRYPSAHPVDLAPCRHRRRKPDLDADPCTAPTRTAAAPSPIWACELIEAPGATAGVDLGKATCRAGRGGADPGPGGGRR